MHFYRLAMKEMEKKANIIKYDYQYIDQYDYIDHIKTRIKTAENVVAKMKKKKLENTYKNLIEQIQDIAGVRIICPLKDDIKKVKELIKEFPDITVMKEKDYVTNPKQSGYCSYHMVILIPIYVNNKSMEIPVEIQIRTLAMDFFASLEHEIKYKSKKEINQQIAEELVECANHINEIDNTMIKLYRQ